MKYTAFVLCGRMDRNCINCGNYVVEVIVMADNPEFVKALANHKAKEGLHPPSDMRDSVSHVVSVHESDVELWEYQVGVRGRYIDDDDPSGQERFQGTTIKVVAESEEQAREIGQREAPYYLSENAYGPKITQLKLIGPHKRKEA